MSVPIRDVLVVHPNAGRRAALASALPSYRVVAVESKKEAAFRMADAAPALIIAPPDDARLFLQQVAHAAPDALRVFICSKSDPAGLAELIQSAAEGHVFSVLDEALSGPELGRTLSHLLQHKGSASTTVVPASYAVQFTLNEQGYAARCSEIGNFGATLLLPGEIPIADFLPGSTLETLRIEHEGRLIFKMPWAHVQRALRVHDEQGDHLRLGISWATAMHPPPPAPGVTMEAQTEVVATLRKALRRGAVLWLQRVNDPSVQLRLEDADVEMMEGVAVLRGLSSGMLEGLAGDEVDVFFEMGGQSYSGVCNLLVNDPDGKMAVQVPRSLVIRNWRSLPRFKPGPDSRFLISFQAPISGHHTTRAALDLSVGGLSFPFDASSEIMPAGSRLDASLLLPDGTSASCQLEVRSIHALPSDGGPDGGLRPFRAGARFSGLSQRARDIILHAFMTSRCRAISDGSVVPFQDVWQLMEEARYRFHPDYPFGDESVMDTLQDTHRRVYSTGDLGRSLVYTGEKGLLGQIAALRIHSRTWLIQHLAVRPGVRRNEQVSYELTNLSVELGEVQHDVEFIRYSWRKDNRWPSRRIGWLARALETPGLSFLRHFCYMRLPLTSEPPTRGVELPRVRDGVRTDYVWIELHLRDRGELVRVLSEDLLTDEVDLSALSERYQSYGLHRRRRVFVVDGEYSPLAVALCEESTPGLNLLEKTNAFWLLIPNRSHPKAHAATQALIQRCVEHARERGRPSAIALVEEEDAAALEEAGFQNLGRFSEWIFHRSMVRRVCELWRSVFERLGGAPAPDWSTEEGLD
ncbi:PilZ domain-containing protein [Vitiosangium sp. GDMCC 1.1324]|uniref:PilZ domain-containing protein n=1 Tax=Vitiosangium sp. (strain GDMCC 1.1324) TaxID=2138576 RepID=UPI000D3CFC22|nr:PilZ domain-containing protein [Vitiosangium sp. GDMCC 1.1324]PTL77484.1 PilZ domain-containing protein [Vitiosangium sp. GDMCC 1.1324]